jgi:hypothetical protein
MSNIILPSLNEKNGRKRNVSSKLKTDKKEKNIKINRVLTDNNYHISKGSYSQRNANTNQSTNYNNIYFNDNFRKKLKYKIDLRDNILLKESMKYRTNIKLNRIKKENNSIKYSNFLNNNKSYNTIVYLNNRPKVLKSNSNKFTFTNYKNDDLTNNNDCENTSSRINYSTKRKKVSNSLEVNNIVNSLISPGKKMSDKVNDANQTTTSFPKERSIDPISYIKYNLQNNPNDKHLYKGINKVMNQLGKSYIKEEYESNLIKKASDVNNLKIDNEHIQAPLGEAKKYKQKYEDLINQTKIFKSFYFNKNETPQRKEKIKYNPHRKILDKIYKVYFDNKIRPNDEKKKEEIKDNKNKTKIEKELEKNMEKYVSFDTRINVVLLASKNTEESVNQKFREHEEMLNKINYLFNSYLKYE